MKLYMGLIVILNFVFGIITKDPLYMNMGCFVAIAIMILNIEEKIDKLLEQNKEKE